MVQKKAPADDQSFPFGETPQQQDEQRFSLLCEGHIIRLNTGTFTMGRSSGCEIVVDDMLASREHAQLHVSPTSIVLEDLHSTNGLFVNGKRVDGILPLHAGDTIVIGTQELQVGALPVNPESTQPSFVTSAPSLTQLDDPDMPSSETISPPSGNSSRKDLAGTERADTFQTINPIVQRLLGQGRIDAVERLLRTLVDAFREGAANGEAIPTDTLEIASDLMARMAESTLDPYWIDSIIELHLHAQHPLPGPVILQLRPLLPSIPGADHALQRAYTKALADIKPSLSLSEQVLVDRTLAILPSSG